MKSVFGKKSIHNKFCFWKKKAVAEEFSIAGLAISLASAFFVVIVAAEVLNFIYHRLT